eukprot:Opistho-1_new@24287
MRTPVSGAQPTTAAQSLKRQPDVATTVAGGVPGAAVGASEEKGARHGHRAAARVHGTTSLTVETRGRFCISVGGGGRSSSFSSVSSDDSPLDDIAAVHAGSASSRTATRMPSDPEGEGDWRGLAYFAPEIIRDMSVIMRL